MRIYSVFIMLEDGRYLYHQSFATEGPPISLMTGLLTAMQSFLVEVTGSYPTVLSAGGFAFHLEKIGPITIVLTCSDDRKPIQSLSQLGMRFINKFGSKVHKWKGNPSEFTDFKKDIEDILGKETVQKHIHPKFPLNSLILLSLQPELQDVAKALIQLGQAKPIDICKLTTITEYEIKLQLENLFNMGHIGRVDKDEDFVYYIR